MQALESDFIMSRLPDFSQIQIPGRRDSAGRVGASSAGPSSAPRDKNDPVKNRFLCY